LHKMISMTSMRKVTAVGVALAALVVVVAAAAQRDLDEPTSVVNFVVLKQDNGKPVRSAAVIMHPVNPRGKQGRGGLELKTDPEGKTSFDGIPYGKLRVQVLARGFQTYGEDFEVNQAKMEITIKLKRPQGQYSIYEDHAEESSPKQNTPPADKKD
jgi:hypothetical protein